MHCFWRHGFEATSVDALVKSIGISRQGLYGDFGGKEALFAACLETYSREVVSPAFAQVEATGATISAIAGYFEFQIRRGEVAGLPGPGCLMANVMTEIAPHNPMIARIVGAHNTRLRTGFRKALVNTADSHDVALTKAEADALANVLVVFANGLWSLSRVTESAAPLRSAVRAQLRLIEQRMAG